MAKDAGKPTVIIVKKKRHHAAHHGGAWKVAYADFITCMFALFLVLWLLTQADLKLRQEIARYFRNSGLTSGGSMLGEVMQSAKSDKAKPLEAALAIVQGSGEDLEALRGHAKEIEEAVERRPELEAIKDHVQIQVTEEGLEIQIVDSGSSRRRDLLFEISSAELKPALVALLRELAQHLGKLPNRIEIGGHTDARPFAVSSGLTNFDLSYARANNARKVLEASGLRPDQVLRVTAYADAKPLNATDPLADENRRLSVLARREGPVGTDGGSGDAGRARGAVAPPIAIPGTPPV